ncbi:hypothetical protein NP493_29g01000 [Ridgeia piscesae]|uniref:Zinc finger-containing ubiquitin peptidase 1 n=1 Tax=Ridgeia piscesae TaxID=27915 RepID=A0AAD9UK38_RIDPI|nr:hypothetical protein NP493_29g01000 [Ridgeia piscesae]
MSFPVLLNMYNECFVLQRDKPMADTSPGAKVSGHYTCDLCGQDGLTDEDMRTHILIEHVEGEISCPFCDLAGTTAEEMNIHVNCEHLNFRSPSKESNGSMVPYSSVTESPCSSDNGPPSPPIMGRPNVMILSKAGSKTTDDVSSSDGTSFSKLSGQQSLKRARLRLDIASSHSTGSLVRVDSQESDEKKHKPRTTELTPSDDTVTNHFVCPMCDWCATSSDEITRHVNVKHLDVLSPQKTLGVDDQNNLIVGPSTSSASSGATYMCPICGLTKSDSRMLERHVNLQHRDILSPGDISDVDGNVVSPLCGCPVCGMEFSDSDSLAVHVDGHFSADQTPTDPQDCQLAQELDRRERAALQLQEERAFQKLQEQYGMKGNDNYKKQSERHLERAVSSGQLSITDYYVKKHAAKSSVDDGHSCTKGIIQKLKAYYKSCPEVVNHWLCSATDHCAASYGDKGWGCGYRNLQMILSCLATSATYEPVIFNGRTLIPSIPKIQQLIEAAWQKGFDLQGCEQLGGKVTNSTKWIGATDIVATLSSLKIQCRLIDFHAPTSVDGTHPRLFEWVRDYFRANTTSFKPPLYLQHQGHSRTIIGVEELQSGSLQLLLFDPSSSRKHMQQFVHGINANLMKSIRRSLHSMRAKQYQIVAVTGILSDPDYERQYRQKPMLGILSGVYGRGILSKFEVGLFVGVCFAGRLMI